MTTSFFNQDLSQRNSRDWDVLTAFHKQPKKRTEIEQGMTPKEIAEIFSDRLMAVVDEQFEAVRKKFQEKDAK